MTTKEEFFKEWFELAKNAIEGKPDEVYAVIAAQLAHESAWGTSELAELGNNYGGVKVGSWTRLTQVNPLDDLEYAAFESPKHFIHSYWSDVINNGYYPQAVEAETAADYLDGLGAYATDPNYFAKVFKLYEQYKHLVLTPKLDPRLDAIPLTRADILNLQAHHNELAAAHRKIANIWGSKL